MGCILFNLYNKCQNNNNQVLIQRKGYLLRITDDDDYNDMKRERERETF